MGLPMFQSTPSCIEAEENGSGQKSARHCPRQPYFGPSQNRVCRISLPSMQQHGSTLEPIGLHLNPASLSGLPEACRRESSTDEEGVNIQRLRGPRREDAIKALPFPLFPHSLLLPSPSI